MILVEKLSEEAEERNILQDNQAGFSKRRGTIDNIYLYIKLCNIEDNKQRKGKIICTFRRFEGSIRHRK